MRKSISGIAISALLLAFTAAFTFAADAAKPVKVYILAGQSNMEGKAKVQLLETQLAKPDTHARFASLQKDGKWTEWPNVWIKFLDRHGNLTVGYGSPGCIGPELGFGEAVSKAYPDRQILLIKTAWGGRSLYRDFRPPSSGLPSDAVLEEMVKKQSTHGKTVTLDKVKEGFGASYREMIAEIHNTLDNLKTDFPQYGGQGYEIDGLVWFQGWNDMIDATATAEYTQNLANFIRDVRKDLKKPELPFVVGQMGVDGASPSEHVVKFKAAEAATVEMPQFKGNVALVKTDQFWDTAADAVFKKGWQKNKAEWDTVGSDYPYHYLGSVKTMLAMGQAFGEAMVKLEDGAK